MKAIMRGTAALLCVVCLSAVAIGDEGGLMEKKTGHAEKIFRYLALGDLTKVEAESDALSAVTHNAGFNSTSERYEEYGKEFLKIVNALRDEARRGNMAGSYYQFTRMTGMCFSCHEHIRDSGK